MVRRKSWHLMLVTLIVESSLEVDESCGATLAAVKYVSADHGARSGGRLDDGREVPNSMIPRARGPCRWGRGRLARWASGQGPSPKKAIPTGGTFLVGIVLWTRETSVHPTLQEVSGRRVPAIELSRSQLPQKRRR